MPVRSRYLAAFLLVGGCGVQAVAQDTTLSPLEWVHVDDKTPDVLPAFKGDWSAVGAPEQLHAATAPTYMEVRVDVLDDGVVSKYQRYCESPYLAGLDMGVRADVHRFIPARRDGAAVPCEVRYYVIFNPASAPSAGPDATPRLLQVVAPSYGTLPADAYATFCKYFKAHSGGSPDSPNCPAVWVQASVDDAGRVTAAQAEEPIGLPFLRDVVEGAVRQWRFAPARKGGVSIAAMVRAPVLLGAPLASPLDMLDESPKVVKGAAPKYPRAMKYSGLEGVVTVDLVVAKDGTVAEAHVVESNNPYFDDAALAALRQWRFKPATVGGKPVMFRAEQKIQFLLSGGGKSFFHVQRNREWPADTPEDYRWDVAPVLRGMSFAIYPFEALAKGREGDVHVSYTIDKSGDILSRQVESAEFTELGDAALAMIDTYHFAPAARQGTPCFAKVDEIVRFRLKGSSNVFVPDGYAELLRRLEKARDSFATADQLDSPLRPLSQRPEVIPASYFKGSIHPKATVEYVVMRDGSVCLPRIVEATSSEFGYAVAQAAGTWRFAPPKRNRRPVDVINQTTIYVDTVNDTLRNVANSHAPAAAHEVHGNRGEQE